MNNYYFNNILEKIKNAKALDIVVHNILKNNPSLLTKIKFIDYSELKSVYKDDSEEISKTLSDLIKIYNMDLNISFYKMFHNKLFIPILLSLFFLIVALVPFTFYQIQELAQFNTTVNNFLSIISFNYLNDVISIEFTKFDTILFCSINLLIGSYFLNGIYHIHIIKKYMINYSINILDSFINLNNRKEIVALVACINQYKSYRELDDLISQNLEKENNNENH